MIDAISPQRPSRVVQHLPDSSCQYLSQYGLPRSVSNRADDFRCVGVGVCVCPTLADEIDGCAVTVGMDIHTANRPIHGRYNDVSSNLFDGFLYGFRRCSSSCSVRSISNNGVQGVKI